MFHFPFAEWIEKVLIKAKSYGSKVYWCWVVIVGFLGAGFIMAWQESGFTSARPLLELTLGLFIVGGLIVAWYEKNNKNKPKG